MTNTGTVTLVDNQNQNYTVTITGMTGASGTSPSFTLGVYINATLELVGTFGAGTYVLNGSNDGGTTWFAMKDYLGNAISGTANAMFILGVLPGLLQIAWSGASANTVAAYLNYSKFNF